MNGFDAPIRRIVIKVGSSVLTDARGRLLPARIEQLAKGAAACKRTGHVPVIVSSGAIACGMARLGLRQRPKALAQLQACAAIGQGELMHVYNAVFSRRGLVTAQVLLTQDDLADRARYRNAKQTLLTLLHRRVVPIINENDTVAVEEITFGDNDRLAAFVACAIDATLLVILSDVDGLLEHGAVVQRVEALSSAYHLVAPAGARQTTKGGMTSKLEAARMVTARGMPMVIANGTSPSALADVLSGKPIGTFFAPRRPGVPPSP